MSNLRGSRLILLLGFIIPCVPLATSCNDNTLLLLNWGEYINQDLVEAFEEKYNCTVKESITESNELFYSKLKSGTTVYDLVVPSDYMVKKMHDNDLLQKIDLSKLKNYKYENFLPGVQGIIEYFQNTVGFKDFNEYQVPYFWGTWGLMYNKRVQGLESALKTNGWNAYFDGTGMPSGVRKGMYNVPRNAYAATMFHNNLSPNVMPTEGEDEDKYLNIMKNDLSKANFDQWGTDDLKKQIQKGDLDVAYMWTGDFLDMYYTDVADGTKTEDIPYDIYIPDKTIAFMDSIVVTKKAIHLDLVYKFIDFFLEYENAKANASVVGYCTPIQKSYDEIVALKTSSESSERAWSYAYENYYPLPKEGEPKFKGTPLIDFNKNYITKVNNVVNDVKVS